MRNQSIAEKIAAVVRECGFTQQRFAKKIGISETAISRWRAGKRNPSISSLKKIAKATKKNLSYFLSNDNNDISINNGDNSAVGRNAKIITVAKDKEIELLKKEIKLLKEEISFLRARSCGD